MGCCSGIFLIFYLCYIFLIINVHLDWVRYFFRVVFIFFFRSCSRMVMNLKRYLTFSTVCVNHRSIIFVVYFLLNLFVFNFVFLVNRNFWIVFFFVKPTQCIYLTRFAVFLNFIIVFHFWQVIVRTVYICFLKYGMLR